MADDSSPDILTLTAEIVTSYVGNAAHVQASEIPAIIKSIRAALSEGDAPQEVATEAGTPRLRLLRSARASRPTG